MQEKVKAIIRREPVYQPVAPNVLTDLEVLADSVSYVFVEDWWRLGIPVDDNLVERFKSGELSRPFIVGDRLAICGFSLLVEYHKIKDLNSLEEAFLDGEVQLVSDRR